MYISLELNTGSAEFNVLFITHLCKMKYITSASVTFTHIEFSIFVMKVYAFHFNLFKHVINFKNPLSTYVFIIC